MCGRKEERRKIYSTSPWEKMSSNSEDTRENIEKVKEIANSVPPDHSGLKY